ncbi:tumor necrosis factor receptor superfamily member 11A [Arapaima gigas]
MRVSFSTVWIFRGWISHLVIAVYAQVASSRPTCPPELYVNKRCCSPCKPGTYQFARCTNDLDTKCLPCGQNEYQPDYNNESKCYQQKICDPVKGFIQEPRENRTAPVPCRCKSGYQCSLVNCEFCVKIEKCQPGYGFVMNGENTPKCCSFSVTFLRKPAFPCLLLFTNLCYFLFFKNKRAQGLVLHANMDTSLTPPPMNPASRGQSEYSWKLSLYVQQ